MAITMTLFPTGFQHTSYVFNSESHVKREMPDLHNVPPGALIKFVQKGILYCEMEANLKEVLPRHMSPGSSLPPHRPSLVSSLEHQLCCRTALLLLMTTCSSLLLMSF